MPNLKQNRIREILTVALLVAAVASTEYWFFQLWRLDWHVPMFYGGDEFCVILQKNLKKTDAMNEQFIREIQEIRVEENRLPIVSFGYAYFDPEDGSFQSAMSHFG